MTYKLKVAALALGASAFLATAAPPSANALTKEAASCQATLAKGLAGFKKAKIKAWQKCLNAVLKGKPCDTVKRDATIAAAIAKATAAIASSGKCPDAILFSAPPNGLGFATNCQLESGTLEPYEQGCFNLPVSNGSQLAACLICWKEGEIYEFLKITYPCLAGTVPNGSDLDCGTPPGSCPAIDDKVTLGCLGAISKGASKWLLAKEKILEKCLNAVASGKIPAPCPDLAASASLAKAFGKLGAGISKKCTSLPPWWNVCPEDSTEACTSTIATVNDIISCVGNAAEEVVDEMICWQYPDADTQGITCPSEGGPTCCSDGRITTQTGPGALVVGTLTAFPFPPGVVTTIDIGTGDACCKHNAIIPAGGFNVPVFCITGLNFTSQVTPNGCALGTGDGNGSLWDGNSTCADADTRTVGDTSDGTCNPPGQVCGVAAGGASNNTLGNIDTTIGANGVDPAGVQVALAIPVHSRTWSAADASCPDGDGMYNPGTDTLISDFDFILRPTTATANASFVDQNADLCSRGAGTSGPNNTRSCSNNHAQPCGANGDCVSPGTCSPTPNAAPTDSGALQGTPPAGPCCVVGQAETVVATGIAFSGGAPLFDLIFANSSPTTVTGCDPPVGGGTCTLSTNSCQF